ncbi:lysophospholipid acyltransferase family protein [Brachybacterium squillarum]|uniref:lysophospholipid acyltransferase family protein n=1 Tax=Brachybacterium squillarum TaxID=661979 RepID=UPI0022228A77|nr:lysophospholipid acyltransferase family protein [Brachybacterium squillarum]MCW1806153.1 1-acyl-sn-glycerol-3-phosphate acyltransferase [Brachybacterium squillarum]
MPTAFYYGARALVRPYVRLFWKPRVTGLENVPREGGYVMAANHLANVDSFLIPVVFDREVHFVSKDDFWKKPGLKGWVLKTFFEQVGAVPLDREALSSGKGALQAGLEVLREGHGFGIYPEGTRSKDGLLHPGKQGAAWLAIESGCPVVPVGVKNTPSIFSVPWRKVRGTVSVRVGRPIEVSEIDPSLSKGARRRLLTARIMDEIQKLSGQTRSDVVLPDAEV